MLLSGGLDSAVLAADEAQTRHVHPVYVAGGLAWEDGEQRVVQELLSHPPLAGRVAPLVRLEFSMRDVYAPTHWAITGTPPAYDTPDEDVYLHGRNVALLEGRGLRRDPKYCPARRRAAGGNPFPDATPQFFAAFSTALSLGLDAAIQIVAPYSHLHKVDVIKRGAELGVPFEFTLSCMNPAGILHCGLLQQVPRAPRRLRRSRIAGSDRLRQPQPAITSSTKVAEHAE